MVNRRRRNQANEETEIHSDQGGDNAANRGESRRTTRSGGSAATQDRQPRARASTNAPNRRRRHPVEEEEEDDVLGQDVGSQSDPEPQRVSPQAGGSRARASRGDANLALIREVLEETKAMRQESREALEKVTRKRAREAEPAPVYKSRACREQGAFVHGLRKKTLDAVDALELLEERLRAAEPVPVGVEEVITELREHLEEGILHALQERAHTLQVADEYGFDVANELKGPEGLGRDPEEAKRLAKILKSKEQEKKQKTTSTASVSLSRPKGPNSNCYNCGRPGHFAVACPQRRRQTFPRQQFFNQPPPQPAAPHPNSMAALFNFMNAFTPKKQ